jgi:hypothetical protein
MCARHLSRAARPSVAVTLHGNPMLPCWPRGRSAWLLATYRLAIGPMPAIAAALPRCSQGCFT